MRLYFDASALIHMVEGAPGASAERFASTAAATGRMGTTIVTSELSLAEVLVKPLREQDFDLIIAYNNLLSVRPSDQIETIPISRNILGLAARIRNKKPSIKLPDAIHIATAEFSGCSEIITGDKRWTGASIIRISDFNTFDLFSFLEMFS